ncbi:MAG: exo-alpha-sialidase [Clostridia bacterium]|nr:exo-alpha-sialidase [Clostridia bacterium]
MKMTTEGILRMAPGDGRLVYEEAPGFEGSGAYISPAGEDGHWKQADCRKIQEGLFEISGLENGTDYIIRLEKPDGSGSWPRLFRCGVFPGTVINYIHPEDKAFFPSGMCTASPSLVRLGKRLILSHDIFFRDMAQNQSRIFYSDDEGANWRLLSELEGCFWGKFFIYEGKLYMLANTHEYGDLVLYRTDNEGKSWTRACTVMKGGNNFNGGPHKSAIPVLLHNGRIWTAVEHGSWFQGGHACGTASATGDITDAANWTVSEFLEYDPSWPGTPKGRSSGCIEGNILVKPDGQLIDFLRFGIDACVPNYGKALYLNLDKNNPGAAPEFGKVVDFHGNHSKFSINYDDSTKKYWTITSRADHEKPRRRNELVLMSSQNIDDWTIEKTLLDYEHTGWHEDDSKAGLQYVDFIFSGDHIYYVSRTALNGALNYHDSNCITFHTVKYK